MLTPRAAAARRAGPSRRRCRPDRRRAAGRRPSRRGVRRRPRDRSSTRSAKLSLPREQPLGEDQVSAERLEHVLPRPYRARRCGSAGRSPAFDRADDVGDEPVGGIVAAADDVARANRSRSAGPAFSKELTADRPPITSSAAALAARIRIVAAHRVALAIRPRPFAVLVAFVGGDADRWLRTLSTRRSGVEHDATVPMTLVA